MSPARLARMRAVLDRRQPDLTVVMENVHKTHNLAAIARSCDAVGVGEVHAVAYESEVRLSQRTSMGSHKWVDLVSHDNIETCYATLRERGIALYVAHLDETAHDYRALDLTRPTAFVMGQEKEGVGEQARDLADGCIFIPMAGMVESLNVSVATATLLFEAKRQRELAGCYDTPRIDPETYRRTLFEWAQPEVAAYCRSKGLPYPALDEDGHVAEPLADR